MSENRKCQERRIEGRSEFELLDGLIGMSKGNRVSLVLPNLTLPGSSAKIQARNNSERMLF